MRSPISRKQATDILAASEPEVRALGVERLALFGSVLRGDARPDSDIDLLVQFSPGAKTFARFLALSELLEQCLGCRVELVTTEALSPFIGRLILSEAHTGAAGSNRSDTRGITGRSSRRAARAHRARSL